MKKNWTLLLVYLFLSVFVKDLCSKPYRSTYLEKKFLDKIDRSKVKVILELGSYHGLDALMLQKHYQCPVFAFEASPINVEKIRKNIKGYNDVYLVEMAVWDESKMIPFFHCVGHPGSSACYKFNYLDLEVRTMEFIKMNKIKATLEDRMKLYDMEKFMVKAIRLDDWIEENEIENIDLICIDLQGAELPALKSLGKYLSRVKYVITEVEYKKIYEGEALFPEVNKFMESQGFTCFFQMKGHLFSDVLFIRNDLI